MKSNLLTVILLAFSITPFVANAQMASSLKKEGQNMVKFNILPLLGGKFAFEYERLLTDRISVGAAISLRPKKGIPFGSTVKDIVDDEELNDLIDNFKSSNFSITPEARFYVSKRGTFRGFYIAPYLKYASYSATLPFDFDVDIDDANTDIYSRTETIPLNGSIQSFTAGLSLGTHFKLSKNIYLDWRIIGPGYGSAKGNVTGKMELDSEEQASLRESLDELKVDLEDLPVGIKIESEVRADGADINILRSPWAGIRTGLSIGYRF
ncbi:DUF3575 domain-containing protein [Sphingobacterium sp. DN00404]|uniref:DUF3575 domain-containing protein n=1 Tax=Sphingobacterium micropteri TaxID=2763501 RepID=A0ABR7YRC2_9SPHI|nr:DUF3575 domain-containing protein [Sphingobacterium micropteri]MBD1433893.1 DUF3575 domain-containing protein [Sphingobacterium micropteri]